MIVNVIRKIILRLRAAQAIPAAAAAED